MVLKSYCPKVLLEILDGVYIKTTIIRPLAKYMFYREKGLKPRVTHNPYPSYLFAKYIYILEVSGIYLKVS